MVGVNFAIPVPLAYYTLAAGSAPGSAISISTDPNSIRFYTKTKTVTARWPSGTKEGAEFSHSDNEIIEVEFFRLKLPSPYRLKYPRRECRFMAEYQLYCFAQSGNAYRVAAHAQSHRRRLGADLGRFLRRRRPAHAAVPHRCQRNGRSAGARERQEKTHAVGRDPQLSRQALGQIRAAGRRRGERGAALDPVRQPEGQRLPRTVPVSDAISPSPPAIRPCWRFSRAASTAILRSSTSGWKRRRSFSAHVRPSPTFRWCGYLYYPPEEFGFDIRQRPCGDRAVARSHQGAAGLGPSLRPDAGLPARTKYA